MHMRTIVSKTLITFFAVHTLFVSLKSSVRPLTRPIISALELFQAHEQYFKNAPPQHLELLREMVDLSASSVREFSLMHMQALVLNFMNNITRSTSEQLEEFIVGNIHLITQKYLNSISTGECSVCNKSMDFGMITLACSHTFCCCCLFKWFLHSVEADNPKANRSCPLCKHEMHEAIQNAFQRHPVYIKAVRCTQ